MARRNRFQLLAICFLFILGASLNAQCVNAGAQTIFNNGNVYAVQNHPTRATVFKLNWATRITMITTYHWNGGKGEPAGTITLRSSAGEVYGPWQVHVESRVYWVANPDTTLAAGTYTVEDSSPSTWAQNAASEGAGMAWIEGSASKTQYTIVDVATYRVVPGSKEQVITYGEKVTVTLPPGFLEKQHTLTVGRLKEVPSFAIKSPGVLALVDLTLDGGVQPLKPVELRVAYDPAELDPAYTPQEQLAAFRWDEKGGGWIALPMRVDERSRSAAVLMDHFSVVGVFKLLGKVLGVGGTAAVVVTSIGEWALNDVYVTPEGNFRILYSKKAIEGHVVLNDSAWGKLNQNPTFAYSGQYPRYIQDIGGFLESALKAYAGTHGFRNPAGERQGWLCKYQKSIIVKMDSYFSAVTGAPSYEKIFERLHIPTDEALSANNARVTLGHELFHVVQAEYYGIAGMTNPMNSWWLEATADYAAHVAAWPAPLAGLDFGCGPNYFTYPISTKGAIAGPGWTDRGYEYITAGWVKYLVDGGVGFREMFEAVAGDVALVPPTRSLANYLADRGGMDALHRAFAAWMAFSPSGFLKKYPLATFSGATDRDIASARSMLTLGTGKEVTHAFDLPVGYTAQLWAIRLQKGVKKGGQKEPLLVKVNEKTSGVVVDLFVIPAGQRTLQPAKPVKSLFTEDASVLVKAWAGDTLCVMAGNGNTSAGRAEVVVVDTGVLLEIDPPEILKAVPNQRYEFKLKAEKIPKQVQKAFFDWDFGDGGEESSGTEEEPVADGGAEAEIHYTYEESDEEQVYTLKVVLKSETGMTLTQSEAKVTMPLGKPQVVIEPGRGVGPPGATFDFTAKARPPGVYRFQWRWPGLDKAVVTQGEDSKVAPVFTQEGEHPVTVELFDADGNLLAQDRATAAVEPAKGGPGGTWVLARRWSEVMGDKSGSPGPQKVSISDGGATTFYTFNQSDYEKAYNIPVQRGVFSHSWSALPAQMQAGKEYEITMGVADAGSLSVKDKYGEMSNPNGSTSLWVYYYPFGYARKDYGLTVGGETITIRKDRQWPSLSKKVLIQAPRLETHQSLFGNDQTSKQARMFDPAKQEILILVGVGSEGNPFGIMYYLYSPGSAESAKIK